MTGTIILVSTICLLLSGRVINNFQNIDTPGIGAIKCTYWYMAAASAGGMAIGFQQLAWGWLLIIFMAAAFVLALVPSVFLLIRLYWTHYSRQYCLQ